MLVNKKHNSFRALNDRKGTGYKKTYAPIISTWSNYEKENQTHNHFTAIIQANPC